MSDERPAVNLSALAEACVQDAEEDPVPLGDLWANQRAVFVFLPPLRSKAARMRLALVSEHLKPFRSLGAEVYLIGPNRPDQADRFEDAQKPDCELYVDPERHAYRAAGLLKEDRKASQSSGILRSLAALLGASFEDVKEGVEYGGLVVIVPPGRVVFAHAAHAVDEPLPIKQAHEALKNSGWSHLAE
ncbi:MAG: redoxin domain-containing protein [Planctomycetes bacterium]|nr:redoxin domain-containing protein [Planctomycetota bacterium]